MTTVCVVILSIAKNLSIHGLRYFTALRSARYDSVRVVCHFNARSEIKNAAKVLFSRIFLYLACQSIVELACDYLYWYLIFGAATQAYAADADVVHDLYD